MNPKQTILGELELAFDSGFGRSSEACQDLHHSPGPDKQQRQVTLGQIGKHRKPLGISDV